MKNFKEVQLVGFKSFADKTSIKFDTGVTCIVGPNGCGKSNVADAVRWVLGEQSAKTLRGSSMQDVIFGGTEARRQLSYCEVTLVFDNHDRLFDIDYEEVAMTRRLYRSGESEYLLNMQSCRLKDIVALLHGVGIGKEGYSIIGQGKVEQIMNAKPEDRRAIFEEATGVMQFKARKGEIERKLESARENLTVFVQRMDEAENQLRPLEKQAETAKKHRILSEELKYEEVNTYLVKSDSFHAETGKHRAKIAEADTKLAAIEKRIGEVDESEARGRTLIAAADEELREINDKLRYFEVGIEHKSGEAKLIAERIKNYRRQLSEASDVVEYSLRRSKQIDADVVSSEKKSGEVDARRKEIDSETQELFKKLQEANARIAAFEQNSERSRASELSSVESLANLRASVGSLSAKRDAAQGRIGEIREGIAKAEERKSQYGAKLEECLQEKAACEKFLDGKDALEEEVVANVRDLTRSSSKLSQDIVDCNTAIANYEHNLVFYKDLKNKFDGYRDSVRRLKLDAQKNPELGRRIKGAIADIVSTDKRYEIAVETAFGGAMQNLVTATADDARYLIEYLKEVKGGVVTFLPVEAMRPREDSREARAALGEQGAEGLASELVKYDPYYDNVMRNLLGNTLVCDTIASATKIAKKYPRAFKIVTLDGDTVATSGAMTGGSHRKDSGNLLAGERRIKECEENIAKRRALLEKLKKALESSEKALDEAKAQHEEFRLKVQQETANFAAICQKENALRSLIADAERDVGEFSAYLEKLTQTVDDLESEVLSSEENEGVLSRIRAEAAKEVAEGQREGEKLKAERDELSERLGTLRAEGAALESARAAEEENVVRLKEEKRRLLDTVDKTRESITKTESMIEELKREEETVALSEDDRKVVADLRQKLASIDGEKRELNAAQSKLAEEKRGLLTEQYKVGEEKHESEIEISRAEANLENMRQRMDEVYGLDYESAQALRDENYNISQSSQNINSLRHKIAALGQVNFNAEEDYDNLLARYTEMQTQREDLDKGILDLTNVLNELRDEMLKQFETGFNEINENFTRVFKELFGGGRAEMQLA